MEKSFRELMAESMVPEKPIKMYTDAKAVFNDEEELYKYMKLYDNLCCGIVENDKCNVMYNPSLFEEFYKLCLLMATSYEAASYSLYPDDYIQTFRFITTDTSFNDELQESLELARKARENHIEEAKKFMREEYEKLNEDNEDLGTLEDEFFKKEQ